MKKIFSLFAAVLFAGSMMAELTTVTYVFQSKDWKAKVGEVTADWTSGKAAGGFKNNGIQVTTTYTGANGTSPESFTDISKIVITYNTNMNAGAGTFDVVIGDNDKVTKNWAYSTGDGRTANYTTEFEYATPQSGAVKLTVNTTENSVYVVSAAITFDYVAPKVEKPVISADAFFYDEQEVSLSCSTEGASIFYTLDGTEPLATSTKYDNVPFKLTETTTVKAIAIKGEDKSEIAEKTLTKNPSFASFKALIDAKLAEHTLVEVAFEDLEIDSLYKTNGIYFTVEGKAYEIYYGKAKVPTTWVKGGKVSGTIRGDWYSWNSLWEVVPSAEDWTWETLTYKAPAPTAVENVESAEKAIKVFETGQLVIIKNGVRYNALGVQF